MSEIDALKTTDDGANVGLIQHVKLDGGAGTESKVSIVDSSGSYVGTESNLLKVEKVDTYNFESSVIKELKEMNIHLQAISGERVSSLDTEG